MKRILIIVAALVATSAAFAAPASANTTLDVDKATATCHWWETVPQCVKRIAGSSFTVNACQPGEAISTCAERVGRTTLNNVITTTFNAVNNAGYTVGAVIVTVDREVDRAMELSENACEIVFPECVQGLLL
jgi:hypothetical protein